MAQEKVPKQLSDYVSIRQAIGMGLRGDYFTDQHTPNRRARAARIVAARLSHQPTLKKIIREEMIREADVKTKFAATLSVAQGTNKHVLQLLERAASLPCNNEHDQTPEPLRGVMVLDVLSKQFVETPSGTGSLQYCRTFAVQNSKGSTPDAGWGAAYLTPPYDKPLQLAMQVDGRELSVPVKSFSVKYQAPVKTEGSQWDSVVTGIGSGTTQVVVNQGSYDARHSRMYSHHGQETYINHDASFDGQVDFCLDEQGELLMVQLGRSNSDSIEPVPGASVEVATFLRDVGRAIFETEQNFSIPNDPGHL